MSSDWPLGYLIASAPAHRWPAVAFAVIITGALASPPARAENAEIVQRQSVQRTDFSNEEIKDGFFKTAFRGELQLDRKAWRIRKFDEPVRVFIANRGSAERSAEIAAVVADIRSRVDHLDLAITDDRKSANFIVMLVPESELARTISSRYGDKNANKIEKSLQPECLSGIGKDKTFRIRRAEVILPVDVDEFSFHDCAYEELLQGLGLINDDSSVPWTMFNDNVQMGFFDVYDQYLVNILYDTRVRPGMTKHQVGKILPEVLPTVREWVAKTNRPRSAQADDRAR